MWNRIKAFFIKIKPSKRKVIQVYAALLHNANMMGFVTGDIFKGDSKIVCAPGLNCYSCPGAVGACPLGTIQNALYESKTKMPTYVLGIILLYCIILGRTVCGWLCPIGLVQELLYKIKTPKLQKNRVTRVLSYFKYVLLFVLVIAVPLIFANKDLPIPGFCKYICPAGTLGGAVALLFNPTNAGLFDYLGPIFTWKFLILIVFVVCSIFIFRFFCRFLCPLGAIYGIFNKLSILGVKVDKSKCDNCGACVAHCKMDVKEVGDHECIMCGECKDVCHVNAIHWKTIGKLVEKDLADCGFVAATDLGDVKLTKNDVEAMEINASSSSVEIKEEEPVLENPAPADDLIEPIIKPKKKFRITTLHQNIFKGICYTLMAGLLIFTFVYANFLTKPLIGLNSKAKDVLVELYNGEQFFSRTDDGAVIYYFYDEFNHKDIWPLEDFTTDRTLEELKVQGKLKVVAISSYQNKDINKEKVARYEEKYKESDYLYFGFDTEDNKLIKSFCGEEKYPYTVFSDINDKVTIHTAEKLDSGDFTSTIIAGVLGQEVGSNVGQICFTTELKIAGSDEIFNLKNNRGRITVLNFWYTGCGPCKEELPFFAELSTTYKDKVDVVTVHEGDLYKEQDVLDFVAKNYPDSNIIWATDKPGSPYHKALNGKGAYPMTVIVDGEGKVAFRINGTLKKSELFNEIDKLIK